MATAARLCASSRARHRLDRSNPPVTPPSSSGDAPAFAPSSSETFVHTKFPIFLSRSRRRGDFKIKSREGFPDRVASSNVQRIRRPFFIFFQSKGAARGAAQRDGATRGRRRPPGLARGSDGCRRARETTPRGAQAPGKNGRGGSSASPAAPERYTEKGGSRRAGRLNDGSQYEYDSRMAF